MFGIKFFSQRENEKKINKTSNEIINDVLHRNFMEIAINTDRV